MPTQHVATLLDATCCVCLATVLRHVGCSWLKFEWSNLSQQHPTCRNTSQHAGQTHATCCAQQCCDMLRWHVAIVSPGLMYIRIILIFSCFLYRERLSYLKRPQIYFNLFDWLGLILILIVIPLRFSRHEAQWFVASLGFFFNVLRLLKYSCITR